jgi:diguanylate cyclase (GGDEF)-like protein
MSEVGNSEVTKPSKTPFAYLRARFKPHIDDAKKLLEESGLDTEKPEVKTARRKLTRRFVENEEEKQTDRLTGLYNRVWFDAEYDRRYAEAIRHNHPLWLVAMDIDHFKHINDNYGHQVGDQALKLIKELPTRKEEPIARIGGEEFLEILDEDFTIEDIATMLQNRSKQFTKISHGVLGNAKILDGKDESKAPRRATLSFGVAKLMPNDSQESLKKRADDALYQAKESGRDRGVFSEVADNGQVMFNQITV